MSESEEKTFATMEPVDPFLYTSQGEEDQDSPSSRETESVHFTLQVVEDEKTGRLESLREISDSTATRRAKQQLELLAAAAGPEQQQQQKGEEGGTSLLPGCYYIDETLVLDCAWDSCPETFSKLEPFMNHVTGHIIDTEVRLNPPPQEDTFLCLWEECGFETISSAEMVRHINFHAFHTKIKCHGLNMLQSNKIQPCQLDSSQKNILPDLSEPLKCEWEGCEQQVAEWTHPLKFYWHVAWHASDIDVTDKVCRWANCRKKAAKFKDHVRSHAQEKRVGCPTCGGLFASRVKFLDHCKRQEVECGGDEENSAFTCSNCGKTFALERLLRDHVRSHINHYRCPSCDMTCPTPSALANHIRYRHTEVKPFPCPRCDYRGKTLHDLKAHARVHGPAEEAVLACQAEGCTYTCRSNAVMKNHVLKHHVQRGPSYACHLCDKLYNRGSYLTRHLVRDHQFTWPSGHSRFRYNREEATGLYRLQTIRFESVELQEQMQEEDGLIITEEAEDDPRSVSPDGAEGSSFRYRTSSPCPPPPSSLTPATLLSPPPSSLVDGDLTALPVGSRSFRDEISSKWGGSSLRDEVGADPWQPAHIQPAPVRRSSRRRESLEFDRIASGTPEDERPNKHKKFKFWK